MANIENDRLARWVDGQIDAASLLDDWNPDAAAGLERFRRGRNIRKKRRRGVVFAAAIVSIVSLSLLAIPPTRVLAQHCVDACLVEANRAGAMFRSEASDRSDELIPERGRMAAPDFALLDEAGRKVQLSVLRGRVVLLNFWATWCAPCKREVPWFVDLQTKYGSSGLDVLGVSMDEDSWQPVKPFMTRFKINYLVVMGDRAVAQKYGGVDVLPMTFLIDKRGRIAARHMGLVEKRIYEQETAAALAEN